MKEGSGEVSRAAARSSLVERAGDELAACAAASLGRRRAVSHIDALETTAVVALTKTEEEGEAPPLPSLPPGRGREEEGEATRTPQALPPSTTISSTLELRTILPPNFSIPRTRASTMVLEPPIG
jgi:hypothetical protein